MRSGFLNILVLSSIICSIYFNKIDQNYLLSSVFTGLSFLLVAYNFLSHHYDFSKKVNQLFLISCILMVIPSLLQNLNIPESGYQLIFSSFYGFSFLLLLLIFWVENNAREYNLNLLFLRIILLIVGFFMVKIFSDLDPSYRTIIGILLGITCFISPNFIFRWKYQNTRNFRFGILAGILVFASLISTAFGPSKSIFLPIGPLEIIAFYFVSVPFIKEKILPNWLVLRFRDTEKAKRRIRRRERFRYKRAMEQENN